MSDTARIQSQLDTALAWICRQSSAFLRYAVLVILEELQRRRDEDLELINRALESAA